MILDQIIINLETISTVIKEIAKLDDYTKAVELGHPNLKTNLADIEHYLEDTLIKLEELKDIEFLNSLNLDETVPMSEDLYLRATELTKGMIADFDEELEGELW